MGERACTFPAAIKLLPLKAKLWKLPCLSSGMPLVSEQTRKHASGAKDPRCRHIKSGNNFRERCEIHPVNSDISSTFQNQSCSVCVCVCLFTCGVEQNWDREALWVNQQQKALLTAHIQLWCGCPADGSRSQSGLDAMLGLCNHRCFLTQHYQNRHIYWWQ